MFELRTSKWDVVERLKDAICQDDEFRALYLLTKAPYFFQQRGGSQPFIWFPHKHDIDDDDYYSVQVETGSHVAPYDTVYAFHWFYFTLAFRERSKKSWSRSIRPAIDSTEMQT